VDSEFLERAEVRDVLAWLRLLVDPQDAAAVVRALGRPPIELRQVDLARAIQIARRSSRQDMVAAVAAASESPNIPPEARERIQRFVELHHSMAAELDDPTRPGLFLDGLIERQGMARQALLTPEEATRRRDSLERLRELAGDFMRATPGSTPRELARHLATISKTGTPVEEQTEIPVADETLETMLGAMREELLEGVARIGGRLGELRLDTDLDISHGVVAYLELVKLAALLQRPAGQSVAETLADINARLSAASTSLQREILQSSTLDDTLLAAERDGTAATPPASPREEHSLGTFLPRKGDGLMLSASDIDTYLSCPLRYKFARVLRIPSEPTRNQRFGIVVHQVLERYHATHGQTLAELLDLLDAGWRRAGLGEGEEERHLRELAHDALTQYHRRVSEEPCDPAWFERQFVFRIGPHQLRGRVDRVDRLPGGGYELIDYKTGRPKSADQLKDDLQLSLYALAAREDWHLDGPVQLAYHYVLDDLKVPVPGAGDAASVKDTVMSVGDGILAQRFEPTPSPSACALCDYRIVCPAAERTVVATRTPTPPPAHAGAGSAGSRAR